MTPEDVAKKRALADELRADPERFTRVREEAGVKLRSIPVMSKGVPQSRGKGRMWLGSAAAAFAAIAALFALRRAKPAA